MSVGLCSAFAAAGNLSEDNWKENRFCRWTGVQVGRGVGGNSGDTGGESKCKERQLGSGDIRGTMGKFTSVEIKKKTVHLYFLKVSVDCKL